MYKLKLTVGTQKWSHNFISVYDPNGKAISLKDEVPEQLLVSYAPEAEYDTATYEWFEGDDSVICKEFRVYMQPQGFNALVQRNKRIIPVREVDILTDHVTQAKK